MQKLHHLFDDRDHLDRLVFLVTLTAEGQYLLHQFLGAHTCIQHPVQIVHNVTVNRQLTLGNFRKSKDCSKDIVEIVGYTAGERSDNLHLLRLAKLPFQLYLVSNIAMNTDKIGNDAFSVPNRGNGCLRLV